MKSADHFLQTHHYVVLKFIMHGTAINLHCRIHLFFLRGSWCKTGTNLPYYVSFTPQRFVVLAGYANSGFQTVINYTKLCSDLELCSVIRE